MSILVIGGSGQLGQDLVARLIGQGADLYAPAHEILDITDEQRVMEQICSLRPSAVINTAAYHDLVECEAHARRAFTVNSLGPRNLAQACRKVRARFVHVSTDYVFDGRRGPYCEGDPPLPLSVYGATKLIGEQLARAEWRETHIVRTSGLFGASACRGKPNGRNFVETMLHMAATRDEVRVVDDQLCCPTHTADLACWLAALVERGAPGVYHAVNGPGLSWFAFAAKIFNLAGIETPLVAVDSGFFPSPVRRPLDSRLETTRAAPVSMPPLDTALASYLAGQTQVVRTADRQLPPPPRGAWSTSDQSPMA